MINALVYCHVKVGAGSLLEVVDLDSGDIVGEAVLPKNGNYPLTCEGLAFSPDGTQIAGVFRSIQSHVFCWNWTDFKQLARQDLDVTSSTIPGSSKYSGSKLHWFPNGNMWLVYGHAVVDREVGGPVFMIPEDPASSIQPRRFIDNNSMLMVQGTQQRKFVGVYQFPDGSLSEAAAVLASGGTAQDAGLPELTKADRASSRILDIADTAWKAAVDASPSSALAAVNQPVKLDVGDFTIVAARLAAASKSIVVQKARDQLQSGTETVLERFNLADGKSQAKVNLDFEANLIATNAAGNLALVRISKGAGRLDIFDLDQGQHVAAWRPYHGLEKKQSVSTMQLRASQQMAAASRAALEAIKQFGQNSPQYQAAKKKSDYLQALGDDVIMSASFIDDQHVVTTSPQHGVAVWSVPDCKSVYTVDTTSSAVPSSGGKFVAISLANKLHLVEAATGSIAGQLPVSGTINALAFRSDGQQLAVVTSDLIGTTFTTFSMSTGEIVSSFPIPGACRSMQWVNTDAVLLDDTKLLHIPTETLAWSYELPSGIHVRHSDDVKAAYISNSTLVAINLPDPSVAGKLTSGSIKREAIVEPGNSVSIQVTAPNPPGKSNFQAELTKAVTDSLGLNQVTVKDSEATKVKVTVSERATGKSVTYRSWVR